MAEPAAEKENETSGGVVCFVPDSFVEFLEKRGEDVADLFEGLAFTRADLRDHRARIPWDDFALLADRLLVRFGDEAFIAHAQEGVANYEAYAPLAALVVEPAWLYAGGRLIGDRLYGGNVETTTWEWLPDGRLHQVIEIVRGRRGSMAFMVASVGAFRALPQHLGLPPADVESKLSPSRGDFWITLPSSATLRARSAALVGRVRARFVERFLDERAVDLLVSAGVPPESVRGDSDFPVVNRRVRERAAAAWQLSPRQREVFAQLADGRSNKEIARLLAIAERTVELHVTTILRKANASTRGELLTRAVRRFSGSR